MIFRSAITGSDGQVDAGYLAIFFCMAVTVTMIPAVLLVGMWLAWTKPDVLMGLAAVVGALGAQCAAVIAAVGVFRAGDKTKEVAPTPAVTVPPTVGVQ